MMIRNYQESDFTFLEDIHDKARLIELEAAGLIEAFKPLVEVYEEEGLFDYTIDIAVDANDKPVAFSAYTEDEVAWLYVHPNLHHQGVGSILLKKALDFGQEIKEVEVLKGNDKAKSFYEKHGFQLEEMVSGRMPGNEIFEVTCYVLSYKR